MSKAKKTTKARSRAKGAASQKAAEASEVNLFKIKLNLETDIDPILGVTTTWTPVVPPGTKPTSDHEQFISVHEYVDNEERSKALEKFWSELDPKVRESVQVFLYKWMKIPALARAAGAYQVLRTEAGTAGNIADKNENNYLTKRGLDRRVRVNKNLSDIHSAVAELFTVLCKAADDELDVLNTGV